ncbi:MAG: hypothetical protein CMM52_16595 [Rhodospirillaceae bacterium]|nr:hypothetical protein [Rhodospirillaceae bacterium]|tara:strand:- start:84684 stop:85451 length:768 start_codon:yes stop_codon:yes gene_type:complete
MSDSIQRKSDLAEAYGRQWIDESEYWASLNYHVRYQDQFLDLVRPTASTKILECGSGTGEIAQRVMEKFLMSDGPNVDFYLVDVSETLLKIISKRIVPPARVRAHLIQATAQELPFADDYFDRIYALSVLWYVSDPLKAVTDMLRVLKPGGIMCFDLISLLNPTGFLGNLSNKILSIGNNRQRVSYFLPSQINKCLREQNVEFNTVGYMPILPTTLPGLGNLFNLFRTIDWLPRTKNGFLIPTCNKVVYCVKKNA